MVILMMMLFGFGFSGCLIVGVVSIMALAVGVVVVVLFVSALFFFGCALILIRKCVSSAPLSKLAVSLTSYMPFGVLVGIWMLRGM